MELIYFDTCSLQRPFDDRSQAKINLESEAILALLSLVENKHIQFVSSDVLEYEISNIPDPVRKYRVKEILGLSNKKLKASDNSVEIAKKVEKSGIKPLDAFHLAMAIEAKVNYFCTSDEKFYKKACNVSLFHGKIVTPLALILELEK